MKFKTFRAIAVGVGVLSIVGLSALVIHLWPEPKPAPPRQSRQPAAKNDRGGGGGGQRGAPNSQRGPGPLRDVDLAILRRLNQNIPGEKVKDALGGRIKVNIYRDAGNTRPNRVKIDLNRNDQWDEKWTVTWSGGEPVILREVAPADDERYSEQYDLVDNARWARPGEEPPTPPVEPERPIDPPAEPGAGADLEQPLRPMDEAILGLVARGIDGDKLQDPFPSEAWKVNLYQDAGSDGVNRLKLDLDRDDRWDEKWDFELDEEGQQKVKRHVSSSDDDATYDLEYRLREGRWVLKQ
jgi:hypothetical protein